MRKPFEARFDARLIKRTSGVPRYGANLFRRSARIEPYAHYQQMRALGPVVWLSRHRVYAVVRYGEARQVLASPHILISGRGVGLNPVVNHFSHGTALASDGEVHAIRRKRMGTPLTPRALRDMKAHIEAMAENVVSAAVRRREVDGVTDLAVSLPMSVVPDLIGWPADGRDRLLRWASATFDTMGPLNHRALRALPVTYAMLRFTRATVRTHNVAPGSLGDELLTSARAAGIAESDCPPLLLDYLAPSLDTTIGAISNALWLFARHPDQWQLLRRDPALIANAVNEAVRLESPLRAFSRLASTDTQIAAVNIPAKSRVLVVYASANRDERAWQDPTRFDITRDASAQLGFGYGEHGCAGQGLARLEAGAILSSLARRVAWIELTGTPQWVNNNIIRRLSTLPIRLVPDGAA